MLLKLLSAISRDLISDRRTARTTTFRLVLLSAISRDLISDGAMIILAVAAHEVTIRYFAGPDLRPSPQQPEKHRHKVFYRYGARRDLNSCPTRPSSDLLTLLSAISRDLISDIPQGQWGAAPEGLLSAISRDLISD